MLCFNVYTFSISIWKFIRFKFNLLKKKNGNIKDLKIGIIGVGHIGTLLLNNLIPLNIEIYLSTNKPERLVNFASIFKLII